MSWKSELRRVKKEQRDAVSHRNKNVESKRKHADKTIKEYNSTLRRLLDGVGQAQWGSGWLGKRYELSSPSRARFSDRGDVLPAIWCVMHKAREHLHHSYSVELVFAADGTPSHFDIKGWENRRITSYSEDALREALKLYSQADPAWTI
jgi:hypothetical protein